MNEMTTIDRTQREYSDAVKKALARRPQLYINGEWVDSSGSATIEARGEQYLAGFANTSRAQYVPGTWRTTLLMRTDVAFAPLSGLLWTIVGLSVVLAAAAAGSSVYWASQFSQPITSLVPFLRAIASGDSA